MLSRRHLVLGVAFVLTLAATLWEPPSSAPQGSNGTISEPVAGGNRHPATGHPNVPRSSTAGGATSTPSAERMTHTAANPFGSSSGLSSAALVNVPPPAPPSAPPLPFTYLGKMQDGTDITVFVSEGGNSHLLHVGDTVAGYRVSRITPNDVTFVYLSLNEEQRLTFESEN